MGGFIQAQSHVQFLCALMNGSPTHPGPGIPRPHSTAAASGSTARTLNLEQPLWAHAGELADLGFEIRQDTARSPFGGGQAIIVRDGTLFGGSDARKDGCALGF